ncbi:MAG TPA: integrase core domain-containing protein [Candidatus Hydrogenedentes bacterium]|nr:integrase core domain-containing protein [Candidatus Hydrogenedentota bacterium]
MEDLFFSLLTLVLQWFRPRYNVHLQLLQAQIRMLRSRIDVSRIVPTPQEKAELLRLAAQVDHDIGEVMHIVQPETYRKWVRQSKRGVIFKRAGRPRIPMATVNLVLRMAQENARWGYRRIVGEFKKLGIRISSSTVKKILKGSGVHPAPDKGFKKPAVPWTTFVHAHMDSMVGCDFFTKRIYTLRGVLTAYLLVFVHLGSRKVYCSPATFNPTGDWVMQQTRNANMWLDDMGVKPRFVIHDRDGKYPGEFKTFWKSEGVRNLLIPIKAPRANSFAETWIEGHKRECLNYFMCFGIEQLDYITRTWVAYYNTRRPHRGVGMKNEVLDKTFVPQSEGVVRCRSELGGLIKSYYREAA